MPKNGPFYQTKFFNDFCGMGGRGKEMSNQNMKGGMKFASYIRCGLEIL
jgi:hypothetical protein